LDVFAGNPQAQASLAGGGGQGMAARALAGISPADQAIASPASGTSGQAAAGPVAVTGSANVTIRVDAGGRTTVQAITIPLANGDQSQRAYVPGTPGPR
jgi:hypothetical protein